MTFLDRSTTLKPYLNPCYKTKQYHNLTSCFSTQVPLINCRVPEKSINSVIWNFNVSLKNHRRSRGSVTRKRLKNTDLAYLIIETVLRTCFIFVKVIWMTCLLSSIIPHSESRVESVNLESSLARQTTELPLLVPTYF